MKSHLTPMDRLGLKIATATKDLAWIKSRVRVMEGQVKRHGSAASLTDLADAKATLLHLRDKIARMNRRLKKLIS